MILYPDIELSPPSSNLYPFDDTSQNQKRPNDGDVLQAAAEPDSAAAQKEDEEPVTEAAAEPLTEAAELQEPADALGPGTKEDKEPKVKRAL